MRDVHVVAVGMIPFGKYPDHGIKDLTATVMKNLFDHSPVQKDAIEAAWMSNAGWGMQIGQHCIRGQVALGPLGIGEIPIMNVENACAGGSSAFHGAWLGVAAGAYDVALAVGAEKTFIPKAASAEDKKKGFDSFLAGTDVEVTTQLIERMKADAERKRKELEASGAIEKGKGGGARSPFMDIYGAAARAHMERFGSTQEQLAIIAAKNHFHGSLNPDAQYRMDMTVEEVLNDRLVSHPLTRAMCAPMGDGAAAAILVSGDALRTLRDARPVDGPSLGAGVGEQQAPQPGEGRGGQGLRDGGRRPGGHRHGRGARRDGLRRAGDDREPGLLRGRRGRSLRRVGRDEARRGEAHQPERRARVSRSPDRRDRPRPDRGDRLPAARRRGRAPGRGRAPRHDGERRRLHRHRRGRHRHSHPRRAARRRPAELAPMAEAPTTLAGVLEAQAAELGAKPFLYFEDRTISFEELDRLVNRAANGLAALGVKPGVGVSIMLPNAPEWLFVYFATQKLGAYAVPVNVALKGEGLRHVVDHSDSSILVCHPDYVETVQGVLDSLPKLTKVVVNATEAPEGWAPPAGWLTLDELMIASDENPGVEIDPEAISAIMYTSGTTGAPKGVVNRYKGMNVAGIRLLGAMLQPDEVPYTCLPLFHANALFLTTVRSLVIGLPMVLSRRFSASRFWDEMRRYGVTTFNGLGAMIPILMKQPERENDRDNQVRFVFSAACPASVWAEFEERFGLRIVEGYAAVDGGGFMVINMGNAPKGSFGKPTSPVRIVDDDGEDVPVGQPGELLFEVDDAKRRKVEYYKNEEASGAKIRDGWLYTGDLVTADADGNLYFVDRKSDSPAATRREHLLLGGGARDRRPPGGARVRGLRRAVGARRGRRDGGRRLEGGSRARGARAHRPLREADGALHGAPLRRVPRRAAEDRDPPRPEGRLEARGRGGSHLGPRRRAVIEERDDESARSHRDPQPRKEPTMASIDLEAQLSDEERGVRETVHKFAEEVMRPAGIALDALADPQDVIADGSILWEVFDKHRELGLDEIADPSSGLSPIQQARLRSIISEELGWGDSGLAISFGVTTFPRMLAMLSGKPALIERFARPEMVGCWAITEPDHGSDQILFATHPNVETLGKPNCIARKDGDSYVVTGQKAAWVSNGNIADAAALFCAVDNGQGIEGVGALLVPLDDPAVSRGKPLDKIGQRALNQGELFFDGVRVPADHLVIPPQAYALFGDAGALPGELRDGRRLHRAGAGGAGPRHRLRQGARPGRRADLRAPEREGAPVRDVPQGRGRPGAEPAGGGVQRGQPAAAAVRDRLEGDLDQHGLRGDERGPADLRRQRPLARVPDREADARRAGVDDRGRLQRGPGPRGGGTALAALADPTCRAIPASSREPTRTVLAASRLQRMRSTPGRS